MFENPRRGRQARNFTTNVAKILDLKSSSEQIFFRNLSLGAPENYQLLGLVVQKVACVIDKTAQNVVKDNLICPRSVKTVELNLFVLH